MRVAALAAAVLAAAFLPGHPLGVSVFLVAALLRVAVWEAGIDAHRALLYGAPAFALVTMSVVRDATWIVAIDLAFAFVLGTVAISGPNLAALDAPDGD